MRRAAPKKLDAITLLAQAGAAKRRRHRLVPILIALAVVVAVLSLIAWWAWPRRSPSSSLWPRTTTWSRRVNRRRCAAQLQATGTDSAGADMADYELYFEQPGGDWQTKATTDKEGVVTLQHAFAADADELAYYLVRSPKGGRRAGTPEITGRVFQWPRETAVLVVDADHALADADADRLRTANNFDIRPLPEAVAALQQIGANHRIVYLSADVDRPEPYLKLRLAAPRLAAPQVPVPGRALARASLAAGRRGPRFVPPRGTRPAQGAVPDGDGRNHSERRGRPHLSRGWGSNPVDREAR